MVANRTEEPAGIAIDGCGWEPRSRLGMPAAHNPVKAIGQPTSDPIGRRRDP
jgi:hypothetical protein